LAVNSTKDGITMGYSRLETIVEAHARPFVDGKTKCARLQVIFHTMQWTNFSQCHNGTNVYSATEDHASAYEIPQLPEYVNPSMYSRTLQPQCHEEIHGRAARTVVHAVGPTCNSSRAFGRGSRPWVHYDFKCEQRPTRLNVPRT
jgi:hypothetical protein